MTDLQSHYFDKKGLIPLIKAVEKAFGQLPDEFNGNQLYMKTLLLYRRPGVYIDSVLRRMRELRDAGKISYLCTSGIDSKYKKIWR